MMKAYKVAKRYSRSYAKIFISIMLIIMMTSCIGNPDSDTPYGDVTNKPANPNYNPYVDLANTAITDITLIASLDYDKANNEVTCYVKVYDQDGNYLSGTLPFTVDNFEIKVGTTVIQSIDRPYSARVGTNSLTGLILDSSGSMTSSRIASTISAANNYVNNMAATDEAAFIDFDDNAWLVVPLTSVKLDLTDEIDLLTADGGTNIGDGIIKCAFSVGARPGRIAGILITDGEDNYDKIPAGVALAKKIGLPIYTIAIGEDYLPDANTDGFGDDCLVDDISTTARTDLQDIATDTGGTMYEVALNNASCPSGTLASTMSTIQTAVGASTPVGSYGMTFTNTLPSGSSSNVLITAKFQNSWGWHTSEITASYYVTP